MKNKKLLAAGLMAGATLGASNSFALEQYFNTPGTRAMGMGGAFVANVGDSSSLWYNPAGLAKIKDSGDATLEIGELVERIDTNEFLNTCSGGPCGDLYDSSNTLKYFAFAKNQQGFAYFSPYRFKNSAFYNVNGTQNAADVETDYRELKWGMGFELSENINFGFTLDWLFRFADIKNINTGEEDELDENEIGFSLGLQGKAPLDDVLPKGHKLTYGLIYRSGTDSEVEDDVTFDAVEGVPGRPQALNYGIGYMAPLPAIMGMNSVITFNYEIDNLEYEDILNALTVNTTGNAEGDLEEERTAFGLEWQMFPEFMGAGSLFVRFGMSDTDIDVSGNPETSMVDSIEASSIGFGIKHGNLVFDIAQETRDVEFIPTLSNVPDQEFDLTAVSISWLF
ncbi:hypothetical protein FHR99_000860 [Litorivivens lipolytica]|uniref:Long-chain fatty acid transport protein n=1 Tax=Litorivivens lipolytica TaxID=1524264 RepID=A0A7W4Z4L4_9GAMM|nr:hypothetical protein [Litorivivens lipolytica]MBB3046624.1 hypothetical protein [Litorivivens lipolytica]